MLLILRYQDELRKPDTYFDSIDTKADGDRGQTCSRIC